MPPSKTLLGPVAVLALAGCAAAGLPNAPLHPSAQIEARPPALQALGGDAAVTDFATWQERRAPMLRQMFAEKMYGAYPAPMAVHILSRQMIAPIAFGGAARVEQWEIGLGADPSAPEFRYHLALVLPRAAKGPIPLVLMENFCGNAAALRKIKGIAPPAGGGCKEGGFSRLLTKAIFGSRIQEPPFGQILGRGYGVAAFYAGEIVPDQAMGALAPLETLTPPGIPADQRPGAIMAWAWAYSRTYEALSADARFDPRRIAIWGHSRNGKAGLVAAAFDPRLPAVIALQPGTGGASLGRDGVGESTAQITQAYPHWFAPAYSAFADRQEDLPIDQHQLLALIAPRPVLVGGARRDVWSDPIGALSALHGADPVYRLTGAPPFTQTDPRRSKLDQPLAYFMRPGLHGVHQVDWDRALDFLDAQWGVPRESLTRPQSASPRPRAAHPRSS